MLNYEKRRYSVQKGKKEKKETKEERAPLPCNGTVERILEKGEEKKEHEEISSTCVWEAEFSSRQMNFEGPCRPGSRQRFLAALASSARDSRARLDDLSQAIFVFPRELC